MASENRDWGYDRIAGALANLGYEISDQTVSNVLRRHGLPPAPNPDKRVQEALQLVFAKFAELQSARQVHIWLREESIELPVKSRHGEAHGVVWRLPDRAQHPDQWRPAVAPDHRDTSTGTGICASKVRVVPPSKRCLKRAWL